MSFNVTLKPIELSGSGIFPLIPGKPRLVKKTKSLPIQFTNQSSGHKLSGNLTTKKVVRFKLPEDTIPPLTRGTVALSRSTIIPISPLPEEVRRVLTQSSLTSSTRDFKEQGIKKTIGLQVSATDFPSLLTDQEKLIIKQKREIDRLIEENALIKSKLERNDEIMRAFVRDQKEISRAVHEIYEISSNGRASFFSVS